MGKGCPPKERREIKGGVKPLSSSLLCGGSSGRLEEKPDESRRGHHTHYHSRNRETFDDPRNGDTGCDSSCVIDGKFRAKLGNETEKVSSKEVTN